MSRPTVTPSDRITTALRLDRDLHHRVAEAAEERDVSVNWLINRALRDFLDNRLVPVGEIVQVREGVPK